MGRRPPTFPLPQAMLWKPFTAGSRLGTPLAEWGYITPEYPSGIRRTQLRAVEPQEQEAVARFWFLSNYEPYVPNAPAFAFDASGAGLDQGVFVQGVSPVGPSSSGSVWDPENWTPYFLLNEEFGDILLDRVTTGLALELEQLSHFWIVIPDLPQQQLRRTRGPLTVNETLESLDRLERALARARGGIGHNRGPSLLDATSEREIAGAIQQARTGVENGSKAEAAAAKTRLSTVATIIGTVVLEKVTEKFIDADWSPALSLASGLWLRLHDTIAALGDLVVMLPI